eukprot:UN13212
MIDELLSIGNITNASCILDVGCGIGGSSRVLAEKFDCQVHGVTLSPRQVERGTELNVRAHLDDLVHLQVANALKLPFDDETFDVVWSLET